MSVRSDRAAGRLVCQCPDTPATNDECPTCRKPRFTPERVAALRGLR